MPGDLRWRWRLCPTRSDFPRPPEPASGLDALRERRPPARGGKARTQRPTLVQKLGGDVGQLASQRRGLGAFDDSQKRVGGRRRSPAVPHPVTPPPPPAQPTSRPQRRGRAQRHRAPCSALGPEKRRRSGPPHCFPFPWLGSSAPYREPEDTKGLCPFTLRRQPRLRVLRFLSFAWLAVVQVPARGAGRRLCSADKDRKARQPGSPPPGRGPRVPLRVSGLRC